MLHLASRSPRRHALLRQLGVDFEPLDVEVIEQRTADESPAEYVQRVALDKALAGLARVGADDAVLAGDTEVVLDGDVFGKPADADAATAMLERLSGRSHEVLSSVWLVTHGRRLVATKRTVVTFMPLTEADIAAYVASGESFGKAGAYAIQGLAAAFVANIDGSYSAVMGLPVFETAELLRSAGLWSIAMADVAPH